MANNDMPPAGNAEASNITSGSAWAETMGNVPFAGERGELAGAAVDEAELAQVAKEAERQRQDRINNLANLAQKYGSREAVREAMAKISEQEDPNFDSRERLSELSRLARAYDVVDGGVSSVEAVGKMRERIEARMDKHYEAGDEKGAERLKKADDVMDAVEGILAARERKVKESQGIGRIGAEGVVSGSKGEGAGEEEDDELEQARLEVVQALNRWRELKERQERERGIVPAEDESGYELPGELGQEIVKAGDRELDVVDTVPEPIEVDAIVEKVPAKELPGEVTDGIPQLPGEVASGEAAIGNPGGDIENPPVNPPVNPPMGVVEVNRYVAGNVSKNQDMREDAHDRAERRLQEELDNARGLKGAIKKMWKGNLFKKYYEMKYTKEEEAKIDINDSRWQAERLSTTRRAALAEIEGMENFMSEEAGEKLYGENPEATEIVRGLIGDFVRNEDGLSEEELQANFKAALANLQRMGSLMKEGTEGADGPIHQARKALLEARRNGASEEEVAKLREAYKSATEKEFGNMDNIYEVAVNIKQDVEHGASLENVLAAFRVANAETRENARTEVHRDAIDKIVNRFEEWQAEGGAWRRIIQPEFIAGAAGLAAYIGQRGAKTAVQAATFGIGGSVATGLFAGMRERNRVAEDRARLLRDVSEGLEAGKSKYDQDVFGTTYAMESAATLRQRIEDAGGSENREDLMRALVEAETRMQFSDGEKKDLISFTSVEQRATERLALMLAMAEAKRNMTPEEREQFNQIHDGLQSEVLASIESDVEGKDAAFKKLRRRRALAQGAKTAAVAFGSMVATQEITAIFDPSKYGVFEHMTGVTTGNSENAQETLMAGLFGQHQQVMDAQTFNRQLTDTEKADWEARGYKVTETPTTTTVTETKTVDANNLAAAGGERVWTTHADNGTTGSDGNELGIWSSPNGRGFMTNMHGDSYVSATGESINFEDDVANGRVMGYLTLTRESQAVRIPIAPTSVLPNGQLVFEGNPILDQCFDENGNFTGAFFEVARDNGVDANGVRQIMSYATDVGSGTKGTIDMVIETPRTDWTTELVGAKPTEAEVAWGPFAPLVRRRNLSRAGRRSGGNGGQQPGGGNGNGGQQPAGNGNGGQQPVGQQPEPQVTPVPQVTPEPAPEPVETEPIFGVTKSGVRFEDAYAYLDETTKDLLLSAEPSVRDSYAEGEGQEFVNWAIEQINAERGLAQAA